MNSSSLCVKDVRNIIYELKKFQEYYTERFRTMGFIIGAIYAILYNIVASITGGLKGDVDLDNRDY